MKIVLSFQFIRVRKPPYCEFWDRRFSISFSWEWEVSPGGDVTSPHETDSNVYRIKKALSTHNSS